MDSNDHCFEQVHEVQQKTNADEVTEVGRICPHGPAPSSIRCVDEFDRQTLSQQPQLNLTTSVAVVPKAGYKRPNTGAPDENN